MSGYGDMLAWAAGQVDADRDEPRLSPALASLEDAIAGAEFWLRRDKLKGAAASLYTATCAAELVTLLRPMIERDGLHIGTEEALMALYFAASRLADADAAEAAFAEVAS